MFSTVCGRWQAFAAVLFACSVAGTSYAFGIFSEIFKDRLGFSQVDLSIIGSLGSTGLYTGVFCGLAIEATGPKTVMLVGALLMALGNLYIWLAVQKLVYHSVPVVALVNFFAQVGVACSSSTVTTVGIRLFPSEVRGQVAGIAKAYFGVAAAVLATIASAFFHSESTDFILFVAIMLPLSQVLGAVNTNFLPPHAVSFSFERSRGRPVYVTPYVYHLCSLMILIVIVGAVRNWANFDGVANGVMGAAVAVMVSLVWALPHLYGPIHMSTEDMQPGTDASPLLDSESSPVDVPPDGASSSVLRADSKLLVASGVPGGAWSGGGAGCDDFISFFGREVPLSEVVRNWRSYAMMGFFMCVAGSGLLVINNIQAIAQAVHQDPSPFFVTVLSLANACGRVVIGVLADKSRYSRFQLQIAVCLSMATAQFLLSLGSPVALYPCLLTVGIMFGCTFSNVSALIADVFGSKHVGANYGFIDLAPIFGSYAFSVGLIAAFYPSSNGGDDGDDDDDADCRGAHCFRYAFYVTTGACLGAAVLAFILHMYTPMKGQKKRKESITPP